MTSTLFIAGDWGTSNLKLYLFHYNNSGSSQILDVRNGPGIGQIKGNFEEVLFDLIDDWIDANGSLPIIISGMVGSTIGWKESPYTSCPAKIKDITRGGIRFIVRDTEITIVNGLKVNNLLGFPDMMRGEELQLIGWMQLNDSKSSVKDKGSNTGNKLLVFPGTHNKWVLLQEDSIETFLTAVTGELFGLLKTHSVLIGDPETDGFDKTAFLQGVKTIERLADAQLIHTLFSTRSEQVLGGLPPGKALSYLSGLLIASDVMGAMPLFQKAAPDIKSVILIGEQHLSERYSLVLSYLGIGAILEDTSRVAMAGYDAIYKNLYIEGNPGNE